MLDLAKLATLTKALVFVALAAAVTILLQSDRLNDQYHSLGSEKFGSPKLLYLFPGSKTVALEPLGSWTREHPGVGDLSVCASFAPLRNDSRALPLLDLWLQDVSSGIETYMEERASDQDVISEWSVLDKHFGHALRRIWETHGTPIFSFWIKQVNVLVAKREGWQYWWDADNQQGTKLSFEEHGFGEWLGKQSMDHRRLSKMERYHEYYDKLGREEDDQFLADASMLCALAQLQMEEQYLTTWQDRNQWMQKPEAMQRLSDAERFMVNIGNNVNKVKYDDIIHAFVWSHLRFMKRKEEDLGPVLSYLGSLCKILPTNEAYMACGHGIGHGINFFSSIEDLPSSAAFNLTQLEAFNFGSVTSMFHEEGRLYEEANAEERNQLAFALLLFGCNHFAPSMSMLPEDLVYVDYASSSCQTGFYHQLFTKATFNVVMAFDSTSEDKVLSSEINSYWNEHLLETCTSMADAYLEALWNHYKNGTKSKLEASLRTTATACFYNRAYFQMEYNDHIIEAYSFVNNHAVSCSKIGRRKCEELCKNEKGLGLHEIKGHNYPFAAMKCMNACLQLATDNVQPLCWSGVGANLAVLAKDCTMFAVRHHEKVTQEAMPGEEPEKIHLEFMSGIPSSTIFLSLSSLSLSLTLKHH